MNPTPLEELRKPHPEQKRIDAEAAALLRATSVDPRLRKPQAAVKTTIELPLIRRLN